jgi:Zn-dependent peptidase ImmA (M78 family)
VPLQTALYAGSRSHSAARQAEQAADYFAGCVLMPRRSLKAAWGRGIQTPAALGNLFDV